MPGPGTESTKGGSPPAPPRETFYKFHGTDGTDHIVDSLELVPEKLRASAEKIELKRPAGEPLERARDQLRRAQARAHTGMRAAKNAQHQVGEIVPFVKELDLPSVAVGFAAGLVAVLAMTIAFRMGKLFVKLGLVLAIVALVGSAYFGWIQRATGLGKDVLSSPIELIHGAEDAAAKVKQRIKDDEAMLKKIEEHAR